MVSHTGRYIMVYNGEIYNHLELRGVGERRAQDTLRGHSDTETLLFASNFGGFQRP